MASFSATRIEILLCSPNVLSGSALLGSPKQRLQTTMAPNLPLKVAYALCTIGPYHNDRGLVQKEAQSRAPFGSPTMRMTSPSGNSPGTRGPRCWTRSSPSDPASPFHPSPSPSHPPGPPRLQKNPQKSLQRLRKQNPKKLWMVSLGSRLMRSDYVRSCDFR